MEKQVGLLTEEEEENYLNDLNDAKLNSENEDSNWKYLSNLKLRNNNNNKNQHNMTTSMIKFAYNNES